MMEAKANGELKNRNASEQLGWRLNIVEANVRAIASHFSIFGIEGKQAEKFKAALDEIVQTARDRFMEATGGK
jgi:hypothetical protein